MDTSKEQHLVNVTEYAAALTELLGPKGRITSNYFRELGKELAKAQEPPRVIPYQDFTISGWTNGELLPTPQAQGALTRLLEEEYAVPEEMLDRLDILYDKAIDSQATQKNQPTELSHAMKQALALSGKSQLELACGMAAKNAAWNKVRKPDANKRGVAKLTATPASISNLLNGTAQYSPKKVFTYAIEQICAPPFSLRAIHENALRERADQLWVTAERAGDLGGLLYACRVRLGESQESFAQRIGMLANKKGFGTGETCSGWESNKNLPVGDRHESGDTLYVPIVQAMKLADRANNGLSQCIPSPWFDRGKEETFLQVFRCAVNQANEGFYKKQLPKLEPIDCPNPKDIHPILRRYDGKLTNSIINGIAKQ